MLILIPEHFPNFWVCSYSQSPLRPLTRSRQRTFSKWLTFLWAVCTGKCLWARGKQWKMACQRFNSISRTTEIRMPTQGESMDPPMWTGGGRNQSPVSDWSSPARWLRGPNSGPKLPCYCCHPPSTNVTEEDIPAQSVRLLEPAHGAINPPQSFSPQRVRVGPMPRLCCEGA